MFSSREIYHLAIQIEKNGEKFYRDALGKISNPLLRELIVWVADQELEHQRWFSKKKESSGAEVDDMELEEMGHNILQEILGDQSFSLEEADLSGIKDTKGLVELAVEFEKDSILFYEMIGTLIEEKEVSEKLHEIIKEEKHHIELLQGFESKGD